MSAGLRRSLHSGQLMLTRDSVISIRRYWRRHERHERCGHERRRGALPAGCRTRHSGHSSSDGEDDDEDGDGEASPSSRPATPAAEQDDEDDEVEAAAAAAGVAASAD